jgi:hypothetical protein
MAFSYAGNLGGAGAPVIRRFHTNESMYVGCFVQSVGAGGQVALLGAATDLNMTSTTPLGFVTGIVDESRAYIGQVSGTAGYGDMTTYSATKTVVKSTGISEVEVCLAIPGVTLMRAPIFNGVWGTALTVLSNTTESTAGTTVVDLVGTADIGNVLGIIYCRTGANRGHYRTIATVSTVTTVVTVPFPHTIAVGDTFVQVCMLPGFHNMMSSAASDCLDGNLTGSDGHSVYFHEINLEEAGQEYAVFCLWGGLANAAT